MKPNRVWVVEYRESRTGEWKVKENIEINRKKMAYKYARLCRLWIPNQKFRVTPYEPVKRRSGK